VIGVEELCGFARVRGVGRVSERLGGEVLLLPYEIDGK
jgi:hypothetical protein